MQRIQAFLQSDGHLSRVYKKWREELVKNLADIEAKIDFEETETLEIDNKITTNVKNLAREVEEFLLGSKKGEVLKNGVRTVIIGEPNVGKSSLLNNLCKFKSLK